MTCYDEAPPDEAVKCQQCDWPVIRGQQFVLLTGLCPECGTTHIIGVVHTSICAMALSMGEPRAATQRRRAGALGRN